VLEAGRIAERGTHEKLLRKKGVYAAMWNRQREADEARSRLERAETEESGEAIEAAIEKDLDLAKRVTSYTP
jgi:ATP-binding cassette subfamily B protein